MTSRYDPEFDRAVMASGNVDMIGDGTMQYDGPRCAADDCRTPVDNDGEWCEDCGDRPHDHTPGGDRPGWCACGRINAATIHQDERPTRDAMTVPPFEYLRPGRVFL